ncbi:MAG: energy transducer TonB [Acidobacteriota bacterium]|jgi:TonB family protein
MWIRKAVGVLVLTSLGSVALPAHAGQVDAWRGKLKEIDEQLRMGEYRKARRGSEKLARTMVDSMGPGREAAYTLAVTCVFRAIAEMGLGDEEAASWYWWTGYSLFNDIVETDMSPYGEPAELLKSRPFRSREGKPEIGELPPARTDRLEPPETRKSPSPDYPEALRQLGIEKTYSVQVVIEEDGSLSDPLILQPVEHSAMAYEILETIRRWEFEPAKLDGKPVPVLYNLAVRFRLKS